ncbi:MAG: hypothetical protein K6B45_08630 [Bacteroidaceae bacterium]|nr:hypothetical protein [Bacteroidaceae bacterium]
MEKKSVKHDHLYYNIQAIEICRKCGVDFSYSTSKDLKKDYLVVENVPTVIEELKKLPCWVKEPKVQKNDGYIIFETDYLHI